MKPKGVKPPKAVEAPKAEAPKAAAKLDAPWGTPELREAAFRALRRAQRTNLRRTNAPKWFTPEQLTQLASDPALADSMMPPPPVKGSRGDDDEDDDDGDDDEDYDDDE